MHKNYLKSTKNEINCDKFKKKKLLYSINCICKLIFFYIPRHKDLNYKVKKNKNKHEILSSGVSVNKMTLA